MRSYRALGGLMSFGVLLLPFVAFADSQLAAETQGPLTATAHLRFRIIIPAVLSLDVADSTRTAGAQTVTVTSNSHAARRGIAKDAPCAMPRLSAAGSTAARADSAPVERMFCTVSMP